MSKKREYDEEYKVQAVKFAKNFGSAKAAAEELQIPVNTLYGQIQKVKTAELDIGCGERSPEEALSIAKENQQLKKRADFIEYIEVGKCQNTSKKLPFSKRDNAVSVFFWGIAIF